jgi:hypothetical protein
MRSSLILLVLLLGALPQVVQADEATLRFGGFAAFDYYQYLLSVEGAAPPGSEAASTVTMLRVAPRLRAKYRWIRASVEAEFRHDFVDPGRGGRVILREATLGLRKDGFRLEAGAILPRWGKMDTTSPTDNLVAWDLEELFSPEPLPVPGMKFGFARDIVAVEVVFIPAFRASRFRREAPSRWDTRWSLPQGQSVPIGLGTLEFANNYSSFLDPVLGGDESEVVRGLEAGARVDLFLPNVDLGFSFAATRDKIPSYTNFRVTNTGDLDGDGTADHIQHLIGEVEVTPVHERLLIPGFDVAVNAGPLIIKGEAAYFHTQDPEATNCLIDDPYVRYAAGLELMLNNIKGDFDLAFRLQYNGDVPLSSSQARDDQEAACPGGQLITPADPEVGLIATDYQSGSQATPHIRHIYKHAFYWNVNMAFTPALALDLRGYADVAGDALLQIEFSAMLLERLKLRVGGLAMLRVAQDTIFTPYANNHRVELGLSYLF